MLIYLSFNFINLGEENLKEDWFRNDYSEKTNWFLFLIDTRKGKYIK